jgi:hypothetical protein
MTFDFAVGTGWMAAGLSSGYRNGVALHCVL